jgi:succinyl-CoA synthetase beta subunit
MNVHEYQAREILQKFGVAVPPAIVANTADEASRGFKQLQHDHNAKLAVVKAQVFAGGRGKGGGVKLVRTADEAHQAASAILSKPLVTPQTPPEGVPVKKLLVAAGVDIEKEYYLGMVIDRAQGCPVLIASSEGGVEIEEVAKTNPQAIVREAIDTDAYLRPFQARRVADRLGFKGKQIREACKIMHQLARMFVDSDASLAEINPLVVTPPSEGHPDGRVLALDAKINFDENALFRQKEIASMADPTETPESERQAQKFGLSFIQLDGNIGCLVNGAGLAMATMDLVKLHGGQPANFLDVGGGASEEAVFEAFKIILADKNVKGVLVNIFGGIMQCDKIARAISNAAEQIGFSLPLVVRLEGTNVEPARKILEERQAQIPMMQPAVDLTDAAQRVTEAIKVA